MTNDTLNLTVPQRPAPKPGTARTVPVLLVGLLIAVVANIGLSLLRPAGATTPGGAVLDAEARKQLALKLERQRLHTEAAGAWRQYMDASRIDNEQAARIWYRIGILYQDAGEWAKALDGFYRSESFATIDGLNTEINRRTRECLESLGKFAALRDELARRTSLDADAGAEGDEVLAEIQGMKITRIDLERRLEAQVERQLTQFAAFMPAAEQARQKEQMLKQFSDAQGRARFLNQLVMEEVLYRKAREDKLSDDPAVRDLLRAQERALLAQKVIGRELAAGINITPGDLQTYYDAHQADYVEKTEQEAKAGEEPVVEERQLTFEECKDRVYRDLRTRKEREIQERLMSQLQNQYDVVIHQAALAGNPEAKQ